MGCDLEHFVIKCYQQCRKVEEEDKGGVGVIVGKSGVAAVCYGWMAMYACLAPYHPDA